MQFEIPKPWRCWCHACEKGFMSIEELQKHDKTPEHDQNKQRYLRVKP